MYSSITKSARYTETCLKLLASFEETVTADDLGQLYTVLVAHMNFLQSECTGLVVKGQFDRETASLFKCLENTHNYFQRREFRQSENSSRNCCRRGPDSQEGHF